MPTDDLIAFLCARLDERAAKARAAEPGPWTVATDSSGGVIVGPDIGIAYDYTGQNLASYEHIAANGPDVVLAEVDTKRRIIELHAGDHDCPELKTGWYPDDWPSDASWGAPGEEWRHASNEHFEGEPCPTLRLLALPDADHPDYREEWRP